MIRFAVECYAEVIAVGVQRHSHVYHNPVAFRLKCSLEQVESAHPGVSVAGKYKDAVGKSVRKYLVARGVYLRSEIDKRTGTFVNLYAPYIFSTHARHIACEVKIFS